MSEPRPSLAPRLQFSKSESGAVFSLLAYVIARVADVSDPEFAVLLTGAMAYLGAYTQPVIKHYYDKAVARLVST